MENEIILIWYRNPIQSVKSHKNETRLSNKLKDRNENEKEESKQTTKVQRESIWNIIKSLKWGKSKQPKLQNC